MPTGNRSRRECGHARSYATVHDSIQSNPYNTHARRAPPYVLLELLDVVDSPHDAVVLDDDRWAAVLQHVRQQLFVHVIKI